MIRIALLTAAIAVFSPAAMGQSNAPRPSNIPQQGLKNYDTERLLRDLVGERRSSQVYAARELRRQARMTVLLLHEPDQDTVMEARLRLSDFDKQLAPACVSVLDQPHVTFLCADILGTLETTSALPALEATFQAADKRRNRKSLERNIDRLQTVLQRTEPQGSRS
ncbi:MAG: hypothetical protein AAFV53_22720 [Myxococcota bacterium]